MIHLIILLVTLTPCLSINDLRPIQTTSFSLSAENIPQYTSLPTQFTATVDLKSQTTQLQKGQVIGSISQLNTINDITLAFEFVYVLNPQQRTIQITFIIRSNEKVSSTFKVVIDFMVARLPSDYSIQKFNMTDYQGHMMLNTNKSYQLVFFVNGWSNLSLSGNITHTYIRQDQMFVIHYMSQEGEENKMGWENGKDYVLFMTILIPNQRKIQKFHLYQTFYFNYKEGYDYFYGIKGIMGSKFDGSFEQTSQGVTFNLKYNKVGSSYGVSLIYMSTQHNYIDERVHQPTSNYLYIIGVVGGLLLGCVVILFCRLYNFEKKSFLNEQSQRVDQLSTTVDISENGSKVQIHKLKHRLEKQACLTIPQVQESLEVSNPGTKNLDEKKMDKN